MSTEIPGSDVRILTAFSVNIHKRKKGILPVECMGLAQEKGAPVLPGAPPIGNVYSNLRNQIHLPPQNVSSCRKRIKKFRTAFCVIFGVSIRIRSRADICAAHPARSAVFRIRSRSVSLCSCGCWTDVLLLPGTGQSLPVIHLLFRKPDRSQRPV